MSANLSEMMYASLTDQPFMVMFVDVEDEFDEESENELTETEEFPDRMVSRDELSVAFYSEEEFGRVVGSSEDEKLEVFMIKPDILSSPCRRWSRFGQSKTSGLQTILIFQPVLLGHNHQHL